MEHPTNSRKGRKLAVFTALVWALQLPVFLLVVPRLQEAFNDFEVELPTATLWLVIASMHLSDSFAFLQQIAPRRVVAIAITIIDAALLVLVAFAARIPRRVVAVALVVGILALVVEALALGLPLLRMIESVSGGKM